MFAELASTLEITEDDRLLQAEGLVRSYCGWHIAPSREVEATFRGDYSGVLSLPSLYVTAVDTVTLADTTELTTDEFTWSEAGIVSRVGTFWYGLVTVAYTHGYAEVPPEVTAVVQAVAQRAVQNPGSLVRTQAGPFADTYSQTGFNQSLPMALLDAERDILGRYKLPPRP